MYMALMKCRLCGSVYKSMGTSDKLLALTTAIDACCGTVKEPGAPSLYAVHHCENGNIGIADFQGYINDG